MLKEESTRRLQLVIDSKIKELVGIPWQKSSCWLDSSLEGLFWAEMRDIQLFLNLLTLYEVTGAPSPITKILSSFDERRHLLMSNRPANEISRILCDQKTTLRQYIVKNNWTHIQSDDAHDSDFSWFVDAVNSTTRTGNVKISNHFGVQFMNFKWCTGPDLDILNEPSKSISINFSHAIVEDISRSHPALNLPTSEYDLCNGKFETFLHHHITEFTKHACESGAISCWHVRDGNVWCTGLAHAAHKVIVVRVERETLVNEWDFPTTVCPVLDENARKVGLEYEVVGRIFWNGNHFVT